MVEDDKYAMQVTDFDYELPEECIAQTPMEPRNASRLMVLDRSTQCIEHRHFYDLQTYLCAGDVLIVNDTRVMPARLFGTRATGAHIEVFLLKRLDSHRWETLVKPGRKARPGEVITFSEELSARVLETTDFGGRIVTFSYDGIFEEILERLGETPLPPYIHEVLEDRERYQTVYAKAQGSAAAPTAGLHFTKDQLTAIGEMGVKVGYVTLHVGLGTFRPVQADEIEMHKMHEEYYELPEETVRLIREAKAAGRRIIAVGTTSVRTLESVANMHGEAKACSGWTNIFIYPGYRFHIVDAMITNFHLPKSTLLMLVSAFAGRDYVLRAYRTAVEEQYRFFSFGDAMLIQ